MLFEPIDTGKRPKISVILGVKNEYPVILGTLMSFVEELEFWEYPYELIVVDNASNDLTPYILKDKLRRWVREKILKVVQYNDRDANVTVRNVGAKHADGELLVLGDGHLSVATGTIHGMAQWWLRKGKMGFIHPAIHIWGDTRDIKCYGYLERLRERFWGNLSRAIPQEAIRNGVQLPHRCILASHCCCMSGADEFKKFGGYIEGLRCYGGGEMSTLKWWLLGSEVWMYAPGLIRHAFGVNAKMRTLSKNKRFRNLVQFEDGTQRHDGKEGDKYIHYSRGYNWTNDQFHHNFMLAAYILGGYEWLQQRYAAYWEMRKGNARYLADLKQMRNEVLMEGRKQREFMEANQVMTLDELLEKKPWEKYDDLEPG